MSHLVGYPEDRFSQNEAQFKSYLVRNREWTETPTIPVCATAIGYTSVFIPYFTEIQIELDIFSGVSNPTWTLNSASADFGAVKAAIAGTNISALSSNLGYRGFVVKTVPTSGATITQTFGRGGQSSNALETALLDSNSANLDSNVVQIAQAAIAGFVSYAMLARSRS